MRTFWSSRTHGSCGFFFLRSLVGVGFARADAMRAYEHHQWVSCGMCVCVCVLEKL